MSRDHRKLRVFGMADDLVVDVYRITHTFPTSERFGLQGQIRRSAVSSATNIVEGSARRSTADYVRFLNVAHASAAETRYLLELSGRLGLVSPSISDITVMRYTALMKALNKLMRALEERSPKA